MTFNYIENQERRRKLMEIRERKISDIQKIERIISRLNTGGRKSQK